MREIFVFSTDSIIFVSRIFLNQRLTSKLLIKTAMRIKYCNTSIFWIENKVDSWQPLSTLLFRCRRSTASNRCQWALCIGWNQVFSGWMTSVTSQTKPSANDAQRAGPHSWSKDVKCLTENSKEFFLRRNTSVHTFYKQDSVTEERCWSDCRMKWCKNGNINIEMRHLLWMETPACSFQISSRSDRSWG